MTQARLEVERIFAGNSEMAMLMKSHDWSQTPLGAISGWASSLKTAVSICLNSRFPMVIWWGKELVMLYNDAWRPILGSKHPKALGRPGQEMWSEIWDIIGLQLNSVLETAEATWSDDTLLLVDRYGYTEEAYFTYSYSPIFLETGEVGGAFTAVTETTRRVIGERRLSTLRELAANTVEAKSVEETCRVASSTLANNPYDIPFALLYLVEQEGRQAQLIGTVRIAAGTPASSEQIDLTQAGDGWKLAQVKQSGNAEQIDELTTRFGALSGGAWDEPSRAAIVLPIAQSGQKDLLAGFLVLGISPRRGFDDEYQGFFDLVANNVATAIANAQAYEVERKRTEALTELDRAKTAFFSNVSHEFRTPLTLMLSPLEDTLANLDGTLPPQAREQLQLVQRNGMRLLKLVNSLLDFSRIEAGRVQASYEPTDLATYTAELASTFRSLIERAGMSLIVECPPLPEEVYVDRGMWEKIVLNLLSNAFKFTLAGKIAVSLQWLGHQVELTVVDTGVGIPSLELPHLFARFHRVENSQGRSFEGSGIGLSLVQELVKLHGGTIGVTSTCGQGSCFRVTLPTGTAHLPKEQISASCTLASTALGAMPYVEQAQRWLATDEKMAVADGLSIGSERLLEQTNSLSTLGATKSAARILLADDNADMRDYIRRLLSASYAVQTVADGVAAKAAIRNNPPDLVLTDVMMPGMDGFELLRLLRGDPVTQDIPIVLLSARAGEESRIAGLEAGADDYLIKPFSARELMARVEATLKLAQLRKTAQQRERFLQLETQAVTVKLEQVLSSLRDGFITFDRNWRYTYINDRQLEIIKMSREAVLGKNVWEVFPDIVETEIYQHFQWAMTAQVMVQFEVYYAPFDGWFDHRLYPTAEGIAVLVTDISARKRIEQEREQLLQQEQAARAAAENANRIKDEFLAVLSHELRSPLNPILGWTRLLQTGKLDEARRVEALRTIERNAKLQAQLIEDLLDISRIMQGKLSLTAAPVSLSFVISAALETVRLAAEAKNIRLALDLDSEIAPISGDAARLQQVVWNLLTNAVKFTPNGGQVTVELTQAKRLAQIRVIDTGIGIKAQFLPHVFEYFRQEDGSTTRRFGGLGLGLAIVRQIVEMHGGTVKAESQGENQGATFIVQLPLIQQAAPLVPEPIIAPADTAAPLDNRQILLVDDDPDTREFQAFLLEQSGAKITAVASGLEALQVLNQLMPDVIVSDIGMAQMDGYMLIQQIRSRPPDRGGAIPALALTAYAAEVDRLRAIEAGFQTFLTKPVEAETLVKALVTLLDGNQPEVEKISLSLE